jgi:hypothetical protein
MKVTTVSASVRYSKALGDGQHKTIELSAEAAIEGKETWTEAQSNLYPQLGQQLKALWGEGNKEGSEKVVQDALENKPTQTSPHYCQEHQAEFKRFEKDGRVWYSHKAQNGKWCREK